MSKKDILSYLLEGNMSISVVQVTICIMIAMLLGLFIYFVYNKTYNGSVYSKNFAHSLIYMTIIIAIIMITIQSNLALSLGMIGSLSIVRFRTAIKEPRDMIFAFWCIAAGVSSGAAVFVPGIIGTVVLGIIAFILSKDIYDKATYLLVIEYKESATDEAEGKVIDIISNNSKKHALKMRTHNAKGQRVTYEIVAKEQGINEIAQKLKEIDLINTYNLVSYSGETIG